MHILETVAPGLTGAIESLSQKQRTQLVATACETAAARIQNLEPASAELLSAIKRRKLLSAAELKTAAELAEAADDRYFALQEAGAERQGWIGWFEKARLLTAIKDGFGGNAGQNAAQAIYELCAIGEDSSELVALVRDQIAILSQSGE